MNKLLTLLTIAESWKNPKYILRQQAIQNAASEFCLSRASFELALDWIFFQWTEKNILAGIQKNPFKKNKYAVQILAGNTPAMIAQGFLQGAILNIPQCLKIPSQQSIFAQLLYQSFCENSDDFSSLLELNYGQENLSQLYENISHADLVIAYGHDETMTTLQQYLQPHTKFITHGHEESVAIIFKEAANAESLEKLAYDMLSYDQRGCLSPRITFIERGGDLSPENFAQLFSEKTLTEIAKQLPRGGLFPGEAEEIFHQRILYGFRGKVYTGSDWTVCYSEKLMWPQTALPRFMPINSFSESFELLSFLQSKKTPLISIGNAGPQEKMESFHSLAKRICSLGEMQKQLLIF